MKLRDTLSKETIDKLNLLKLSQTQNTSSNSNKKDNTIIQNVISELTPLKNVDELHSSTQVSQDIMNKQIQEHIFPNLYIDCERYTYGALFKDTDCRSIIFLVYFKGENGKRISRPMTLVEIGGFVEVWRKQYNGSHTEHIKKYERNYATRLYYDKPVIKINKFMSTINSVDIIPNELFKYSVNFNVIGKDSPMPIFSVCDNKNMMCPHPANEVEMIGIKEMLNKCLSKHEKKDMLRELETVNDLVSKWSYQSIVPGIFSHHKTIINKYSTNNIEKTIY